MNVKYNPSLFFIDLLPLNQAGDAVD